jgi:molecular chaperone HtpG
VIRNKLVRKTIAMFQQLGDAETAEEKAKYAKFWKSYGTNIKLGVIEDSGNRARLAKLLRYLSSTTGENTSFDDYVARMKEGQEDIYYLSGDSVEALKTSPLLEKLTEKGYEVLFAVDPIDEYTFQNLPKYDKYKLVNLAKEGVKLPGEEDEDKDHEEDLKEVIAYLKKTFSSKISRAKVSNRLSRSPCALVAESWGHTAQMEKVMRAQALSSKDDPKSRMWAGKKVLDINPRHPIVLELNRLITADVADPTAKDVATLLLDTAAISSGYNIDQPASFVTRVLRMISTSLDLPEAVIEDLAAPAAAEPAKKAAADEDEDEDDGGVDLDFEGDDEHDEL